MIREKILTHTEGVFSFTFDHIVPFSCTMTTIYVIMKPDGSFAEALINIHATSKDEESAKRTALFALKRQFACAKFDWFETTGQRSVHVRASMNIDAERAIKIKNLALSLPPLIHWGGMRFFFDWLLNRWIRHRLLKRLVRAMSRSTQHGAEEKRNAETQDRQPQ